MIKIKELKRKIVYKYQALIEDKDGNISLLNSNDVELLIYCSEQKRSVSEIAEYLGIKTKNISIRLPKLEKLGLIITEEFNRGKKRYIKTLVNIPKSFDVKTQILEIIMKKSKISISKIHLLVKDSQGKDYNYRTIWQHVKSLSDAGLIDLVKEEHQKGKPVFAIINNYHNGGQEWKTK